MLNRTIALDVFATVLIGGIILEAAYSKRLDTLPILVVLSLVGFVGSVTVARFSAIEPSERQGAITTQLDPKDADSSPECENHAEEV